MGNIVKPDQQNCSFYNLCDQKYNNCALDCFCFSSAIKDEAIKRIIDYQEQANISEIGKVKGRK